MVHAPMYNHHSMILTLLNVKGVNSAFKRRKILLYLKQKNPDLVFLQETHLEKEDSLFLQRDWVGKVLYRAGSFSQRGVAILIRKNFNVKILKQQSDEYTFMNIYAPTADLPGFFVEVSNEITQFGNSYVVLYGDFNNVRNPKVDKTYTWGITRPSQAQKAIDTLEEELDLVDVWRFFHPSDKEFTFYSHPHISYSRIDYFLISKSLLSITEQTTIGTILVSDHAPVRFTLRLGRLSKLRPTRWRFNSSRLKDEQSWNAFKAVIGGRLIQHCSYLKKKSVQHVHELEVDIKKMEKMHSTQSDHSTLLELNKLKAKYNLYYRRKLNIHYSELNTNIMNKGREQGDFLHREQSSSIPNQLYQGCCYKCCIRHILSKSL
uniref:exodeoxyribonuclease III n=1 Tax=Mola mola TaxID=94237 RepID=A0A3Q4ASB2_MOLML